MDEERPKCGGRLSIMMEVTGYSELPQRSLKLLPCVSLCELMSGSPKTFPSAWRKKHAQAAVTIMTHPSCTEITSEKYGVFKISFDHNKKVLFPLCPVSKFQAFKHIKMGKNLKYPSEKHWAAKHWVISQYLQNSKTFNVALRLGNPHRSTVSVSFA